MDKLKEFKENVNMDKRKIRKFGHSQYLLGKRKEDNKEVYLTEASWDCNWYWGFGYVETFEVKDIYDHQHFDDLFLKTGIPNAFIDYFKETPLNKKEIYILLGYMKEFYIMQKYAELLQYGNYITQDAISVIEEKNKKQNQKEVKRINEELIPELLNKIYKLLESEEK